MTHEIIIIAWTISGNTVVRFPIGKVDRFGPRPGPCVQRFRTHVRTSGDNGNHARQEVELRPGLIHATQTISCTTYSSHPKIISSIHLAQSRPSVVSLVQYPCSIKFSSQHPFNTSS